MKRLALFGIWLACLLASAVTLWRMLWCVVLNPAKAMSIAIGIDRALNTAANGGRTETVSSRASRARGAGRRWGCVLCRVLDWIETDHCRNAEGI